MAAPITHIVLTAKIFDKLFKDKNKKEFFIGSCFPDIRYLKVIEREKTHFNNLAVVDLKNNSAFDTGLKFHSILDIAREKFIVENSLYSLCPESKYITVSVKLLEDELHYKKITNWNNYVDYLKEILTEEINIGVDINDVQKWHNLLSNYFRTKPNTKSVTDFMHGVYYTDDDIQEIFENLKIIKADKKVVEILNNLYKKFDALIA